MASLNAHLAVQPTEIWHQQMGHMSIPALWRYTSAVSGLSLDSPSDHDSSSPCPGCELGKHTRLPFPGSNKRSKKRLQIVHSDLARPLQVRSLHGAHYIATFIDDYSCHGVVYFLHTKDQCADVFKKFLAWAELQTSDKLLTLHSDRRGKYILRTLQTLLKDRGIEHKLTMPGTPQQNRVAEHWNHTIFDKVRDIASSLAPEVTSLYVTTWVRVGVNRAQALYDTVVSSTFHLFPLVSIEFWTMHSASFS